MSVYDPRALRTTERFSIYSLTHLTEAISGHYSLLILVSFGIVLHIETSSSVHASRGEAVSQAYAMRATMTAMNDKKHYYDGSNDLSQEYRNSKTRQDLNLENRCEETYSVKIANAYYVVVCSSSYNETMQYLEKALSVRR